MFRSHLDKTTAQRILWGKDSPIEFDAKIRDAVQKRDVAFFQNLVSRNNFQDNIIWELCLQVLNQGVSLGNEWESSQKVLSKHDIEFLEFFCRVLKQTERKCNITYMLRIYDAISQASPKVIPQELQNKLRNMFLDAFNHNQRYITITDEERATLELRQKEAITKNDQQLLVYVCKLAQITKTPSTRLLQVQLLTHILAEHSSGKLRDQEARQLQKIVTDNLPAREDSRADHNAQVNNIHVAAKMYWKHPEHRDLFQKHLFDKSRLTDPSAIATIVASIIVRLDDINLAHKRVDNLLPIISTQLHSITFSAITSPAPREEDQGLPPKPTQ